jgi:hypothetical protein
MKAVIDTNVVRVANGDHAEASPDCVEECVRRLRAISSNGITVIDDSFRVLGEYLKSPRSSAPKGVGAVFVKWLLRHAENSEHVHQVAITEFGPELFNEFPDQSLQPHFDAPDRKFAAVANTHADRPPVWQATDSKWLAWWQQLAAKGVQVDFLCPGDVCTKYSKKFPGRPVPALPPGGVP